MKQPVFDVVVVGGGHAGCEAAHASARIGANTLLITLKKDTIGVMSCNPAIGGLGKGHLVREIDALGGIMARVADRSGIQFRLLNRRKGPAVQGPRAQSDRTAYRQEIQTIIFNTPNLTVLEGEVSALIVDKQKVGGVVLSDGSEISTSSLVLTTGTFLGGVIHIGHQSKEAGRLGEAPSINLAQQLREFGFPVSRLKTGTPPRLATSSIQWEVLEMQPGDEDPVFFSFATKSPALSQISCGITWTNEKTHDIIRANLDKSAMYGGKIAGKGPRYCPSIEDKVVRFADKTSHQIFLEPEGLGQNSVYPNGISTSLPAEVQVDYVRSIAGLSEAEILQPGYAIEYDFVDPTALKGSLETKFLGGLFFAGQINGTTGYEEAAAQGLVAGLNAAHNSMHRDPVFFRRTESYIGVLIDDLISRGVTEPYRMFTSRAEYRLSLRADNADQRLTPLAMELGLVSEGQAARFKDKADFLGRATELAKSTYPESPERFVESVGVNRSGKKRSVYELLAIPDINKSGLWATVPQSDDFGADILDQVNRDALYANYIVRQEREVAALRRDESVQIPDGFDYLSVNGLSSEICSKLMTNRPGSIAAASKIEGITPAALVLLLARLKATSKKNVG